jgi:hypothetical protein
MSENTVSTTELAATEAADKLQKAAELAELVKLAAREMAKAETANRRGIVDTVLATVTAGDIVRNAIASGYVGNVNTFARHAAGFTTVKSWHEYVAARRAEAGDDALQVAVPRQKSYSRAVQLAEALADVQWEKREDIAALVDEYLQTTPDAPTALNGATSFLQWAVNGFKFEPKAAPAPKSRTFKPAQLAVKLQRAGKLSPAQLRQLAAQLVKLADAATTAPKAEQKAA